MALSKKDLQEIKSLLAENNQSIEKKFAKELSVNNQIIIEALENHMKENYVTKDDFKKFRSDIFEKIDSFAKEIKTSREEQTVMSGQIRDHEDRITNLEKTSLIQ